MYSKPWVANIAILWVFDASGNFVQLKGVIGDGWDDEGHLMTALEFDIPTTVAELELDGFKPAEEDDVLFKRPVKPVETSDSSEAKTEEGR